MNSENFYCRLCAELKHTQKLVDLQLDPETSRNLIDKLARVNASTEFFDSKLPKTVCLDCLRTLDKCFEFVKRIESAQNTLIEIANQNVKIEYQDVDLGLSPEEFSEGEILEAYEVKRIKTEQSDELCDIKAVVKPRKIKKRDDSLDSIPLSQLKAKDSWMCFNWICTRCKMSFQTIGDLQTHSIAVHNICNPWRCSIGPCLVRKQSLENFLVHVQKHNKQLKRNCYKCFKSFNTISKSQKHRRSHLRTDFNCPGCFSCFENNEELRQHKEMYFDCKLKKDLNIPPSAMSGKTCLICSKSFKTNTNVRIHIMRMHTERHPEHICDVCGKAFYDKHNRAQHMLHVHTDYRPHKCHICKLGFKTPKSLKDHIGRHFNAKPLECDKCGKHFRLKKHLTKHSVIHTDALPFQCTYCEKRFQRKQYLTNHLLQHTGEKPYSCEPCQQHFASWGNYNKHMICRHNQDMAKKKPVLVDRCVDEL